MSNRDTQFQGFAKALWDELEQAIRQDPGFIPEGDTRRNKHIPVWQEIIARRAYDLVEHTIDQVTITTRELYTDREILELIPDMTELPKEQEPESITLDRFIAMLDERGLSSHQYTEPRYSSSFGSYTAHMIDIGKDGKVLATYDTGAIIGTVFTEKCMAQELDGLYEGYDDHKEQE